MKVWREVIVTIVLVVAAGVSLGVIAVTATEGNEEPVVKQQHCVKCERIERLLNLHGYYLHEVE